MCVVEGMMNRLCKIALVVFTILIGVACTNKGIADDKTVWLAEASKVYAVYPVLDKHKNNPVYIQKVVIDGTDCVIITQFRGNGIDCNWRN